MTIKALAPSTKVILEFNSLVVVVVERGGGKIRFLVTVRGGRGWFLLLSGRGEGRGFGFAPWVSCFSASTVDAYDRREKK